MTHGAQGTRQVVMMAGQRGERDKGMDSGLGVIKRDTTAEPRRDSVGVGNDTRGEYGACDVHRAGTGGAYDVRADGVGVLDNGEHDAMAEPSGDRVGVGADTQDEYGACNVHGAGSGGAHGLRGDGVGVEDISKTPGDAWSSGDTADGNNRRGVERERDTCMVIGFGVIERDAMAELSGDKASVGDITRD